MIDERRQRILNALERQRTRKSCPITSCETVSPLKPALLYSTQHARDSHSRLRAPPSLPDNANRNFPSVLPLFDRSSHDIPLLPFDLLTPCDIAACSSTTTDTMETPRSSIMKLEAERDFLWQSMKSQPLCVKCESMRTSLRAENLEVLDLREQLAELLPLAMKAAEVEEIRDTPKLTQALWLNLRPVSVRKCHSHYISHTLVFM